MGLAYYGRTYKLSDPSCDKMGCNFEGPGAAGPCTAFEGVMSNREIQSMIKKDGLVPFFNQTAMVKYLTHHDDSWVGYDDPETLAMKQNFANSLCLGGLMIWSIDFDVEAGSGVPEDPESDDGSAGGIGSASELVWVSPDIWDQPNPQIHCKFPCTVVLPPYTKGSATTAYPLVTITSSGYTTMVTRPPMTVSVWWMSTNVIGPASTVFKVSQWPETVTTQATLFTTRTWPVFTATDTIGGTIRTSATESRKPPPALPEVTFISGLPPRPTTKPYPTPCINLFGLCEPGEEKNDPEDEPISGDGKCEGKDCATAGCETSCGGCKLGALCDICIGLDCIGCITLKCISCKGPLCNICVSANCFGCSGLQCTTCKGPDCVSCTRGRCGTTTCSDLQCPVGTDPGRDEQEEEDDEKSKYGLQSDPEENNNEPDDPSQDNGDSPGHTAGQPTKTATSIPIPVQTPDFSNPSTTSNWCYDQGQLATREHMLQATDAFYRTYDGIAFGGGSFQAAIVGFGWQEVHKSGLNILVRLEAKNNCTWTLTREECNEQFVALVDGCDQEGIINKQGGTRQNSCLIWRIDPEHNSDVQAPAPTPSSPDKPTAPQRPEVKNGKHPKQNVWQP